MKYYEIGKAFYLLRSKENEFHRNIYLKRYAGKDRNINILMDPGTKLDIQDLTLFLNETIGGIENVDMVFLSHQDPDVTSNSNAVLTAAPKAIIVASIDTWRLIQMYGISEKRFLSTEKFSFGKLKLKHTGHEVQFVPARFCHFRGAMMFYDHESGVLFTGDVFAGVNTRKGDGYKATKDSWNGISTFHQIYMPSTQALGETVRRIRMLNPRPLTIAPQHGDVITDEMVPEFLSRLEKLDVGIELKKNIEPEKSLVLSVLNQFFTFIKNTYPDIYPKLMKTVQRGGEFTCPMKFTTGKVTDISMKVEEILLYVWNSVEQVVPKSLTTEIKTHFIIGLDSMSISVPEKMTFASNENKALDL